MSEATRLTTKTKLIFGLGDWGTSAAATARNIFWFVFLTNVVGLNPGLAGGIWLVGRLWDAVNDPLIGSLSDRLHSRWGRRRPFLLIGAVPFALTFFLLFFIPPFESTAALVIYYSIIFLLYDTLYTVVNVPYLALVPELAQTYDERSSLTGWRTAFSFLAQLATAGAFKLLAENVFAPWFGGGPDGIRLGYLLAAGLWALSMALPLILLALTIREPEREPVSSPIRLLGNFREVFNNRPFRLAALIYLLCFTTGDVILLVFVRYLIDYVRVRPGFDSVVLAVVLSASLLSIPLVLALMRRTDKRTAYLISIGFMVAVLTVGAFLPPGVQNPLLIGAVLAGMGFAAMSIIPWAIVADVIEVDELQTGERREGLYTGYLVFLRKLATGLFVFGVGQLLSATGYVSSTTGSLFIDQPRAALNAMRFLVTVIPAVALALSLVLAWRFPLDREAHEAIRRELEARRAGL
ncbi:putative Symporter YagG [Candidatus Promineifilum breve]|uniref:Symporter YagG n=1 Tax=Candidatus Promineifilum breve TaxID=1806508 RepID=A0A160T490_9CHLR|nr:glycoside-pentoside-hexuronide (GPH):cation symporter [Candidatus Promineifilum breve]CUS04612.2 putative Symporter YagG [Candidatus Promineifilum breve]